MAYPEGRPSTSRAERRILSLRAGQIALLVGLILVIAMQSVISIYSVVGDDKDRARLYSEEADSSAITFVQRESFGVVIALDAWARGDVTARDVQIARALLGQRLQVVTASGSTTYDMVGDSYRARLDEIDEVVRSLSDLPLTERVSLRVGAGVDGVVDAFLSRSRELSSIFQELTRAGSVAAIVARAATEQLQAAFAAITVVMGIGLAAWILRDINVATRRASRRLLIETRQLQSARRSLDFGRQLQMYAAEWSDAVASGASNDHIVLVLRDDLRRLMPEVAVGVHAQSGGLRRFAHVQGPTEVSPLEKGDARLSEIPDDDIVAAIDRANEILHRAFTRDSREQHFDLERRHDTLTGLPNRSQLLESITRAAARASTRRRGAVVGMALINIGRFAEVNSSFGLVEADRLLVEVAHRLRARCSDEHMVLRLASAEFAVVGSFASQGGAIRFFGSVARAVSFTTLVGGATAVIAVAVGVVASRSLDIAPDALIKRAVVALSSAKSAVPAKPLHVFDWQADDHLLDAMHEESALRLALSAGEFVSHFQPIVSLATGAIRGCEALVRWNRPGFGMVPPGDFLPTVARAGLTVEFGLWIIDHTLTTWGAQRLASGGTLHEVYISINLDAEQLADPALAQYIINAAQRSSVPPHCLVLEVTEHALIVGDVAVEQLTRLRAHGIRIALDDFGTGYSNLSQLGSLPLDILKIDRSFLPDPTSAQQQQFLIGEIVSIAASFDLAVIAEGIETAAVAHDLSELGVGFGQGWHYARAMPIDELALWLSTPHRHPVTAV